MDRRGLSLLLAAFAFTTIQSSFGAPFSYVGPIGGSYNVTPVDGDTRTGFSIAVQHKDGKVCTNYVTVSGRGVMDTFHLKCENTNGLTYIAPKDFVLYNNSQEPLTLFTNTSSTLLVIKDRKCTKRTYNTTKGSTTTEISPMSELECENFITEVSETERQLQRELREEIYMPEEDSDRLQVKRDRLEEKIDKLREEIYMLEEELSKVEEEMGLVTGAK